MTEVEAESGAGRQRELDRIAAFTDGVIAIAITLLVLNLDVPNPDAPSGHHLADTLLDAWPDLFAYGLSFAVIGRYWVVHHRFFATLARYDARLVTLNLLFLAFLVLIPFATELLGEFSDEAPAVIAYAVVLAAVGLADWLVIRHSVRAGLVASHRRADAARFASRRALAMPGIMVLSIPVALVSPTAAAIMWVSILLVHPGWRGFRLRR